MRQNYSPWTFDFLPIGNVENYALYACCGYVLIADATIKKPDYRRPHVICVARNKMEAVNIAFTLWLNAINNLEQSILPYVAGDIIHDILLNEELRYQ